MREVASAAQMSAGSQTKVGRAECTCDASEAVQKDRYTMGKFPLQPVKRCLHRPRRSVHAASKRCHTAGNQRRGLLKRPERPHRTFDHIWEIVRLCRRKSDPLRPKPRLQKVKYAFRAWRRAPRLTRKRVAAVSIPSAAPPISRRVGGQVTSRAVKHFWMFPQCSLQLRQDVRADGPIVLAGASNRARDTAEWAVEMAERSANGLKFDLILCGSRELVDGMPAPA